MKTTKPVKRRNLPAKHGGKFNHAQPQVDRKKQLKSGYTKHPLTKREGK